ncbi:MAG: Tim44 domain-containing protein [Syntrophobacter sp.]
MKKGRRWGAAMVLSLIVVFTAFVVMESSAWARAGGGGSSGSRGSRSFSSPSAPSGPSSGFPGINSPGRNPSAGFPSQSQGGFFSRSPFMSGLAGGLAGGLLGGMLFGGTGHAASGMGGGGGGIGLLDIAIIGLLLYFGWRFLKRRRDAAQAFQGTSYSQSYAEPGFSNPSSPPYVPEGEVEEGYRRLQQADPGFSEQALKEEFEDIFFRVQAAWMNRSLDGAVGILTPEMTAYFIGEFEGMKKQGRINRLENIAIRKVEPSEIWREEGRDYVTVLITANLLDYTVDDQTGQVVGGDRLNPVKFEEFWTFCREIGTSPWQLAGINQPGQASLRAN